MEKGHLEGWVTHFFLVYKSNESEYIYAWNIGEINVLWLLSVIHNRLSKFGESILNSLNKIKIESWTCFFPHVWWNLSGFSHLSPWSILFIAELLCSNDTIHVLEAPGSLPHLLFKYLAIFWTCVILLLWFCYLGDAKIGNNSVNSLKNDDFTVRGLRRDGNADDIWTASQNSKSCGKSISIETANLREYARYVLRTICQQVLTSQFEYVTVLLERDSHYCTKLVHR